MTDRLVQATKEAGCEALVALSPENVAYMAGFVVPSQPLMRWRHAATVLAADGRQAMLCVDMEETTVRSARPGLDVRTWREFGGSAMEELAHLLIDMGLAHGRVALETSYLPAQDYAELARLLPGAELEPAHELLAGCRRIKTAEEQALLAKLSRIADASIGAACSAVRAGCTEMDIAADLTRALYANGAQDFKLMIIATGERSQLPNVGPSLRVLAPGDICRVEVFPVIGGYHAGVCRTAVVGEPGPEALRIYSHLATCKQVVLDILGPGVQARKVYEGFRREFDILGLSPISFVGHGIGLDLHEAPYLSASDESTLEEGLVLGVEPLAYRTGYGFGMQIKDMVALEAAGARVLSDVTDTYQMLHIEA